MITTVSIYLTYRAATDTDNFKTNIDDCENKEQALNIVARQNLFYSTTFIMNMIVMFIYWIFLHKDALNYFKIDGVSKFLPINIYTGRVIYLYTVHTIPALACLSNVLITNCLMKINLFLIIFSIGGIFGIVSYIFSMKTGIVLYWFLDPKLGLIIFSFNSITCSL